MTPGVPNLRLARAAYQFLACFAGPWLFLVDLHDLSTKLYSLFSHVLILSLDLHCDLIRLASLLT